MRPRERRESGEQDLFRSRLDQIIDTKHALRKLAARSTGGFGREIRCRLQDGAGQPPLPTVDGGLAILKHTYNLSDEGRAVDREPVSSIFAVECRCRWTFSINGATAWARSGCKAVAGELGGGSRSGAMKPGDLARHRRHHGSRRTSPSRPTPSC
jgi:hypothetical protein